MLRLLIDQDLDHDILRGLIRRVGQIDAATAFEVGMSDATDTELLIWAAQARRLLVTHDRTTMPAYAADLMRAGTLIAGLCVVPRTMSLGQVLQDLEIMIACSENEDWFNVILYLPF